MSKKLTIEVASKQFSEHLRQLKLRTYGKTFTDVVKEETVAVINLWSKKIKPVSIAKSKRSIKDRYTLTEDGGTRRFVNAKKVAEKSGMSFNRARIFINSNGQYKTAKNLQPTGMYEVRDTKYTLSVSRKYLKNIMKQKQARVGLTKAIPLAAGLSVGLKLDISNNQLNSLLQEAGKYGRGLITANNDIAQIGVTSNGKLNRINFAGTALKLALVGRVNYFKNKAKAELYNRIKK